MYYYARTGAPEHPELPPSLLLSLPPSLPPSPTLSDEIAAEAWIFPVLSQAKREHGARRSGPGGSVSP